MNEELVHHCILVAQESFRESDLDGCMSFLNCVQMASDVFPSLCSKKEDYETLLELYEECQRVPGTENRKALEKAGTLSVMSKILSSVSPVWKESGEGLDLDRQKQFLKVCTGDGTPEQAKHNISIMASMIGSVDEDESDQYGGILKALTSSSRMAIGNDKVVNVLAALTALAEKRPSLFQKGPGSKAIRFALETVLLGRGGSKSDQEDRDEEDEDFEDEAVATPSKRKSKSPGKSPGRRKNMTPAKHVALLDNTSLSVACRRACSALEFLVAHIRMSVLQQRAGKDVMVPSVSHIAQIFEMLAHVLRDRGLPPSNRDRRDCKDRQDRAALRQCCALQLFRLCDRRLAIRVGNGLKNLQENFLSIPMWHTLAGSLLDEEHAVRESAIEELSNMQLGKGYFAASQEVDAMAPSLRFVAMSVFCADGDGHRVHSVANGNAANVGKLSLQMKSSTLQAVLQLRKTCEQVLNGCRQAGKEAERQFEYNLKMKVMPEYAVPFAIHLLCLRRETPSAGGSVPGVPGLTQPVEDVKDNSDDEGDDEYTIDDMAQQKMLRKRLKWLFEPLVESLGSGADNISFLLRLSEMIGSHHQPVELHTAKQTAKLSQSDESFESLGLSPGSPEVRNRALLVAKLKTTCLAAREVLLSFVKKDINLSTYPGQVFLPSSLFQKLDIKGSQESFSSIATKSSADPARRKSSASGTKDGKNSNRSRVHFSPELVARKPSPKEKPNIADIAKEFGAEFNGTSPAKDSPAARSTPGQSTRSAASEKTMGTTPPSNIKTAPSTYEGSSPEEKRESTSVFDVDSDLSMTPSPRAKRAAARRKNELDSKGKSPDSVTEKRAASLAKASLETNDGDEDDDNSSHESPARNMRSTRRSSAPLTQVSAASSSTTSPASDGEHEEEDRKPKAKRKSSPTSVAITKKHRKTKVSVGQRSSFDSMSTVSTGGRSSTRKRASMKSNGKNSVSSDDDMDFHENDEEDAEFALSQRNGRSKKRPITKANKSKKTAARTSFDSMSTLESLPQPKRSRVAKKPVGDSGQSSDDESVEGSGRNASEHKPTDSHSTSRRRKQKNGDGFTQMGSQSTVASSPPRATRRNRKLAPESPLIGLSEKADDGDNSETEEHKVKAGRKRRGGQSDGASPKKKSKAPIRSSSLETEHTASSLGSRSRNGKRTKKEPTDDDSFDAAFPSGRSSKRAGREPVKSSVMEADSDDSNDETDADSPVKQSRRPKKSSPTRPRSKKAAGRATSTQTSEERSSSLSSTSTRSSRRTASKKEAVSKKGVVKDPLDFDSGDDDKEDSVPDSPVKKTTKRRTTKKAATKTAKSGAKKESSTTATETRRSRRTRK